MLLEPSPQLRNKKTKYSGMCLILSRLECSCLLENNTGLNVIKHMERYMNVFCSHMILRHYSVMHHLYSKFHLWISRHFLQGAELTLTSPFVRWVWKCSWSLFTWGRKTTGRASNPLFFRFLTSVSSFPQFLFPDNMEENYSFSTLL